MTTIKSGRTIQVAQVVANRSLCLEHYRISMVLSEFPEVLPGQFVHLSPEPPFGCDYYTHEGYPYQPRNQWQTIVEAPLLRRAFSVAGVCRSREGITVDVIYRVVGTATRWLETLRENDSLSVLGPLGNGFPISEKKPKAWMVAGGVGLPPMLLLASTLGKRGKETVAFCGARSADLIPLTIEQPFNEVPNDGAASLCCKEFAQCNASTVISTDDGSLGFAGHVGQAMEAYYATNRIESNDVVVYTCGPERMMRHVASLCAKWGIECYACMERAMACGTGLCQSCVVGEKEKSGSDEWRYRLCCTDGPVFDASRICW